MAGEITSMEIYPKDVFKRKLSQMNMIEKVAYIRDMAKFANLMSNVKIIVPKVNLKRPLDNVSNRIAAMEEFFSIIDCLDKVKDVLYNGKNIKVRPSILRATAYNPWFSDPQFLAAKVVLDARESHIYKHSGEMTRIEDFIDTVNANVVLEVGPKLFGKLFTKSK